MGGTPAPLNAEPDMTTTPDPEFSPTNAMAAWMQALAPYGIFTTDRSLRIRSWNDWLAGNSDRPSSSVVGRPLVEVYPDIGLRHLDRHYARALQGEVILLSTALHKYLLPFRSTATESPSAHMLQTVRIAPLSEGGEIVGTITVIEDVSQREIQAGLLQRQQELERLLSATLAVLLQSRDPSAEFAGIFASIAPTLGLDAYVAYLPDEPGERLLLHSATGLSPRQRDSVAELALTKTDQIRLRRPSAPADLDIAGHLGALRRLGLQTQGSFPLVAGDRLLGLIVFARYEQNTIAASDLTILSRLTRYIALAVDRSLRERETLAASRAKDDFLAALSHELRTPLNLVLLLASESQTNTDFSAEAREAFRMIEKSVLLEARLIDDLLDLTRIEHGKLTLEKQVVSLHALLRDASETVRADITQQKLTLTLDLAANDPRVLGDAARLQQVFWNVLKNAVKFTPDGGRITIATASDLPNQEVVVRISDTGIGLSQSELTNVFGAFAQGEHSRGAGSHRFGGLGLGLAISRTLVELHEGRITAESAGRNQGATFTIRLPVVAARAHPGLQAAAGAGPPPDASGNPFGSGRRSRILLVEDHEPSRATMVHLLKRRGYEIRDVGSSTAALKVAAAENFDLVISDIGLPDMDGASLMKQLHDQHGMIGIALSGYGMEADLARSADAGFLAHLTKPITVDALDRALAKVFATGPGS